MLSRFRGCDVQFHHNLECPFDTDLHTSEPPDRYSYPAICKVNVTVKTAVDGSYLSYRESKVCSQVNPGIIESMDPCGKGK
jgi:hypothetical protein